MSASRFHKLVKCISSRSIKDFRLGLTNIGYYILNLKMYVLHSIAKTVDKTLSDTIRKKDKQYAVFFFKDKMLKTTVKMLKAQFKVLPSLNEIKVLLVKVSAMADVKLKPLINNIVWRRLKFLSYSNSIDLESIRAELKAKLVQSFYWLMPYKKETVYHWVMTMIKPLKNHAINLVNFYTTKKRVRMYEDHEGKYKVKEISIDAILSDENREGMQLSDGNEYKVNVENKVALKQVYDRFAITSKRILAFKLLSGTFDGEFTQWLRANKYISGLSNMDNTDYQDKEDPMLFLRLVAAFVGIRWDHFYRMITRIRSSLVEPTSTKGVSDNYVLNSAYASSSP
jgi:hypothetical protein